MHARQMTFTRVCMTGHGLSSSPSFFGHPVHPPSLTPERARHTSYPNKMKFKLLSLGSVEVGHVVGLRSATKPNSRDAGIMPVYVQ